jgi:hypothetical protein
MNPTPNMDWNMKMSGNSVGSIDLRTGWDLRYLQFRQMLMVPRHSQSLNATEQNSIGIDREAKEPQRSAGPFLREMAFTLVSPNIAPGEKLQSKRSAGNAMTSLHSIQLRQWANNCRSPR